MPTEGNSNSNSNSKSSTKSRVKSKTRSRRRGFSLVRQRDSMQCGAACLTMVCRHFGADASLDDVDQVLCATNDGVSLLAISRVADSFRLENAAGRLSLEQLRQAPLPAILHWDQNHFVVLYGISRRGRFLIADPGKGRRSCSESDLLDHWASITSPEGVRKGVALLFDPDSSPDFSALRGTRVRHSLRFLGSYVSRYRAHFLQILLGLLLAALLQLALPFLTQAIVDRGIRLRDPGIIQLILLGELVIVAGRTLTDFIRRWLLLHISMRINISLVSDFLIKLLRLPMSFFDVKLTGDLLQRMADHGRVQSFLTGQTLGIVFSMVSLLVFGVVLLLYSPVVFAVFLLSSVVYALWTALFLRRRRVLDNELFAAQAENQNRTYQLLTTVQEIKLQGCRKRRRWEWEDAQAGLFSVQMKSLRLQQTQEAGSILINEVRNILITVLAANAVIRGEMTLGAMLAIQYVAGQLSSPVEQLMAFAYSLQDVGISLERINEIRSRPDEQPPGRGLEGFPSPSRDIVLSDVRFRYDPHAPQDVIRGVSLSIPAGKVTAIVGASGSGKSTLLKLLLGYYPPGSGSISVAGEPLGSYSPDWWRGECGAVMQDGVIFSDSIARNIAVRDGGAPAGRIREAARLACIDSFIESLPLKYDTRIGHDGLQLSQGQKQRILIARAICADPAFLFLDEATNSLDAVNERAIVSNLADFYRGRTVVVVAHRLSTVRDADRIVVLDAGRVAETGTHEELVERRGLYYSLVRNQLELGT